MTIRVAALVVVAGFAWPALLLAQPSDRSVERFSAALERPSQLGTGEFIWTDPAPKKLGVLTLLPPEHPGEIVRLRVPIGELLAKGARGLTRANNRRREAAARHEVQRALSAFIAQRKAP